MGRVKDVSDELFATAKRVIQLLTQRRKTLAVAEASGGLVGHLLTEVPGSSAAFLGGVIAYGNSVKEAIGVPQDVIAAHGAVSAETAAALAQAVRRWAGSDYGLAVTGVAGPGGATQEKPVGLTFVAFVSDQRDGCERHVFSGDRSVIKRSSAAASLDLLLRALKQDA